MLSKQCTLLRRKHRPLIQAPLGEVGCGGGGAWAISLDGVGNSNFTIDSGNLTINNTTSGDVKWTKMIESRNKSPKFSNGDNYFSEKYQVVFMQN